MDTKPPISIPRALGEIVLVLFVFLIIGGYIALYYQFGPAAFSRETLDYLMTPEGIESARVPGLWMLPVGMVLALLTIYGLQRSRGETLKEIGFGKPKGWGWAFKWGVIFAFLLYLVSLGALYGLQALGFEQTSDDFLVIRDDPYLFIYTLTAISWVSAAFGEEIMFRGFILRNLTAIFGTSKIGHGVAIVGQAAIFGVLHINQDVGGAIAVFIIALVLGFLFVKMGRQLWPLIFAHGIYDNSQFILLYYFG